MRKAKFRSYLVPMLLFAGIALGFPTAAVGADAVTSTEALILGPGMAVSCQEDFVVENTGAGAAELQIVLGNDEFLSDRVQASEAKSYGLRQSLSLAKMQGLPVDFDDVATIVNTDEKENIRVVCPE